MFINFWLATEAPSERDRELILGDEDYVLKPPGTPLEVLAREAAVFSSSSEAKRAGLVGPVPWGLNAWGTKQKRFWTFRPEPHDDQIVVQPMFDKTNVMLASTS